MRKSPLRGSLLLASLHIRLPKTKGHHAWSDDEIAQYRDYWPLGTQQRLVMEFALVDRI